MGTAFFYVLNASFFFVLLKNATFFYVLFSCFWQLMKPKWTMRSFMFFSKEHKRIQRTQHSFAKNVENVAFFCKERKRTQRVQHYFAKNLKERKERIVLLQKNGRTLHSFFTFFYILFQDFCLFWTTYETKKTFLSFLATYETQKERCVLLCSFLKKLKEHRECCDLLQRTEKNVENVEFFCKECRECNILLQRT